MAIGKGGLTWAGRWVHHPPGLSTSSSSSTSFSVSQSKVDIVYPATPFYKKRSVGVRNKWESFLTL
jgi:hypothetical protein